MNEINSRTKVGDYWLLVFLDADKLEPVLTSNKLYFNINNLEKLAIKTNKEKFTTAISNSKNWIQKMRYNRNRIVLSSNFIFDITMIG